MAVSVKSLLMSGISVVGASAIAIAPVHAPPPDISTSYHPAPVRVVSDEFVELLAAVQPITVTADPVALNGAGEAVIDAWNTVLPWIDYGVELAAYAADFIPFGFFIPIGWDISAQIDIFYFALIRPVANSFVVDLVAPVVSDPLNLDSYINGLTTLGSVTWNSLQNFVVEEFNFFFGWLIPPLPPIPPLQSAVAEPMAAMSLAAGEEQTALPEGTEETEEPTLQTTEATDEGEEPVTEVEEAEEPVTAVTEIDETDEPVTEIDEVSEVEEIDETEAEEPVTGVEDVEDVEETPETGPTKSTNGTIAAQGEVRGADVDSTDVADGASEDSADNDNDGSPGVSQIDAAATTGATAPSDGAGDDAGDDGGAAGDGGQA